MASPYFFMGFISSFLECTCLIRFLNVYSLFCSFGPVSRGCTNRVGQCDVLQKSRWSMCLQTIMTEAWKVNTALGQDWKCVMMPTLREWELLLILL